MSPRIKKLIGTAVLLPVIVIYALGAMLLADFVPTFWVFQLVYFLVAGVAWAFPLKYLMKWMNAPS
ncbi:MAG: DUF2842 domain-containing protein [Pseudomonadota bacterium]